MLARREAKKKAIQARNLQLLKLIFTVWKTITSQTGLKVRKRMKISAAQRREAAKMRKDELRILVLKVVFETWQLMSRFQKEERAKAQKKLQEQPSIPRMEHQHSSGSRFPDISSSGSTTKGTLLTTPQPPSSTRSASPRSMRQQILEYNLRAKTSGSINGNNGQPSKEYRFARVLSATELGAKAKQNAYPPIPNESPRSPFRKSFSHASAKKSCANPNCHSDLQHNSDHLSQQSSFVTNESQERPQFEVHSPVYRDHHRAVGVRHPILRGQSVIIQKSQLSSVYGVSGLLKESPEVARSRNTPKKANPDGMESSEPQTYINTPEKVSLVMDGRRFPYTLPDNTLPPPTKQSLLTKPLALPVRLKRLSSKQHSSSKNKALTMFPTLAPYLS